MAPTPPAPADGPAGHRLFQGSGAAAAGVLFAVLFVVGFYVLDREVHRSQTDLVAYYNGSGGTAILIAGAYVVPFAGICFLWFLAASRHRIGQLTLREDALLATVQLTTGVLFVAMFFIAAAAAVASVASIRLSEQATGTAVAQLSVTMTAYGQAVLMIYGIRIAAVFIIASTTRAARAGLFPRWLTVVSYVSAAVLMVALSYIRLVVVILPVWVAVTSCVILFRRVTGRLESA